MKNVNKKMDYEYYFSFSNRPYSLSRLNLCNCILLPVRVMSAL